MLLMTKMSTCSFLRNINFSLMQIEIGLFDEYVTFHHNDYSLSNSTNNCLKLLESSSLSMYLISFLELEVISAAGSIDTISLMTLFSSKLPPFAMVIWYPTPNLKKIIKLFHNNMIQETERSFIKNVRFCLRICDFGSIALNTVKS